MAGIAFCVIFDSIKIILKLSIVPMLIFYAVSL